MHRLRLKRTQMRDPQGGRRRAPPKLNHLGELGRVGLAAARRLGEWLAESAYGHGDTAAVRRLRTLPIMLALIKSLLNSMKKVQGWIGLRGRPAVVAGLSFPPRAALNRAC
jgi:hypothetical protein